MEISVTDARGLFLKYVVAKYIERPIVFGFLRSFFPTDETAAKEISIEVMRGTEKVAVDVLRGTEGNRVSMTRSTEKIILPPYYRQYMDATDQALYDRLFGTSSEIDSAIFAQFTQDMAASVGMMTDMIERSYELQCAQVLETGIVQLNSGINIDFKRRALSLVDNSATPWTGAYNPYTQLEVGTKFLRSKGKSQGSVVNAIFGAEALSAFLSNSFVVARNNLRNLILDAVAPPQRDSVGGNLIGEITVGSSIVRIWTYDEGYEDASGNFIPYINPKKVILLPVKPNFKLVFAGVPQLINQTTTVKKGAFLIGEYDDARNTAHIVDVKSAGVALPIAIDQIWTAQVVA